MNQRLLVSVTFLCSVISLSGSSFADTLFNNLEPGNVASAPGFYCLGTGNCATSYWVDAMAFTPSTTASLADIGVTIAYGSGQNSATIQLLSDAGGLPGSLIESWTVNNLFAFQPNTAIPATFVTSNLDPILDAGQQYWIAVIAGTPGDKANLLYWKAPLPATYNPFATSQDGGPYTIVANPYVGDGGFRVDGTDPPVPEPSNLMLVGTGILGVLGVARRRLHR